MNILLVKPYQPCTNFVVSPPLGILMLTSTIRQQLGNKVTVRVCDAKITKTPNADLVDDFAWADIVGLSALNFEALVCSEAAAMVKSLDASKIVVLGGPYSHKRAVEILTKENNIDWVFDGESERSFPAALRAHLDGQEFDDIPGLYYRSDEKIIEPTGNDFIEDLDSLPLAAWEEVDFEAYAKAPNMNAWLKGNRYAMLFTSRGCPYKCAYCHDIFTKKFRWRSAESVLQEITLLVDKYGVDEFQIVDDIFNLHKPRLKQIFAGLEEQYGQGKLNFCFPNGLRGDILDKEVIQSLKRGGTYQITVAVDTVTDRLQRLIQKDLDVNKVRSFIQYCHEEGILVKSFFMIGFPTETRQELWNTIIFAWRAPLTFATFFTVVPQPGTPLHDLALSEGPEALNALQKGHYWAKQGWYQQTYGYNVRQATLIAYLVFYFDPRRILHTLKHVGFSKTKHAAFGFLSILFNIDVHSIKPRLKALFRGQYRESLKTHHRVGEEALHSR